MNPYIAKIEKVLASAQAIEDGAADGVMSADELSQYEAHLDQVEDLKAQSEKWEASKKRMDAFAAPVTPRASAPRVEVADKPNYAADPMKGFKSPREFFQAVMDAPKSGKVDERLGFLAAVGSDEQSTAYDPYGGFLVPEAMSPDVKQVNSEADPTVGRTTMVPMGAPVVKINARVDKNHSSSVSGGLTVSRTPERGTPSSSRMKLEQVSLGVNKLTGLSYVTSELMQDSPISVAALLAQGFQDEFGSHLFNEKLNGGGVGEFEGVMNSPALVTVAKEGSQAADTIVAANIYKMYARCYGKGNAIWLANHDTLPQLAALNDGTNNIWLSSLREGEPSTLMGLPIFFSEYTKTLGDKGDILLCDWSQYLEGSYQPLESAESIHVRFVEGETAFRFEMRNDGRSWWRGVLTPKNGATLSPFVTLAARA